MNTARQANHHAPHSNLTEMYPGVYRPGSDSISDGDEGPNLPTGPLNTLLGFELETYQIPLDQLLPSKKVPDGVMSTRKYKQIVSSINEVGLIEPLSVIQPDRKKPEYLVLDGHLRVLALKELGMSVGPCLFAKDDESYSYNHHVNRLSTIAEHYMIRRAIDRGVSKERLARAFNVNLSSINRRINLLEGICPEAITLLQDKQFTPDVTRILRNMKAARQVEAVELMIASNTITVAHAEALLKATPPEHSNSRINRNVESAAFSASFSSESLFVSGNQQQTSGERLATTEWELGYQAVQASFSGQLQMQDGSSVSFAFEFSMQVSWARYSYTEQPLLQFSIAEKADVDLKALFTA